MATKLENLPYHSDRVWGLVRARGPKTEVHVIFAQSPAQVWLSAKLLSGLERQDLQACGWVCRPFDIQEVGARSR